jgi:hypothetical protein
MRVSVKLMLFFSLSYIRQIWYYEEYNFNYKKFCK